ncbi:hypothetical protein [uncultured Thiodictyon sp.]|uniref:hypothetical protein n=1 Tax=uncultured Thiodictyon sp. TaxID=1846217 RepID=UPI0025DF5CF5|nr:hypothetical protein [uncultured Thiodictyon sp.]
MRQNYAHTQAVKALVPGVPVFGRVVFTDDSRFPKGIPEGVSSLRDLNRDLREVLGDAPPSPALIAAWAKLKGCVDRSTGARQAHLDGIRARHGAGEAKPLPWRLLLPVLPVLLAVLWVWSIPKPAVPTVRVRPAPVVLAPVVALPTPTPTPTPPPVVSVPRPPAAAPPAKAAKPPPTLEWSDPAARAQSDCNAAIAALLIDNSQENRNARDRACGQGQADAVPTRSLPRR